MRDFFRRPHLGSTRCLANKNTYTIQENNYYPFGESLQETGVETSYKFTGKELDSGTGLYYFGARYYDPSIGRWLVPDPLSQYFSPYVYCGNNPFNNRDIDGRWSVADDVPQNLAATLLSILSIAQNFAYGNGVGNNNVKYAFKYLNNNTERNFGGRPVNLSEFVPFGAGPEIVLRNIANAGRYQGQYFPDRINQIQLNKGLIEAYSLSKAGSLEKEYYLTVILRALFHETGHWATLYLQGLLEDEIEKKLSGYEAGEDVEYIIFGNSEAISPTDKPTQAGFSKYKTTHVYVPTSEVESVCQYYYSQGYGVYINGKEWTP